MSKERQAGGVAVREEEEDARWPRKASSTSFLRRGSAQRTARLAAIWVGGSVAQVDAHFSEDAARTPDRFPDGIESGWGGGEVEEGC